WWSTRPRGGRASGGHWSRRRSSGPRRTAAGAWSSPPTRTGTRCRRPSTSPSASSPPRSSTGWSSNSRARRPPPLRGPAGRAPGGSAPAWAVAIGGPRALVEMLLAAPLAGRPAREMVEARLLVVAALFLGAGAEPALATRIAEGHVGATLAERVLKEAVGAG